MPPQRHACVIIVFNYNLLYLQRPNGEPSLRSVNATFDGTYGRIPATAGMCSRTLHCPYPTRYAHNGFPLIGSLHIRSEAGHVLTLIGFHPRPCAGAASSGRG